VVAHEPVAAIGAHLAMVIDGRHVPLCRTGM